MKLSIRVQPTYRCAFSPCTCSVMFFHCESDKSTSSNDTTFWEPSTQYTKSNVLARPLDTISNCRRPFELSSPTSVPLEARSWRMVATNTKPSLFWICFKSCRRIGVLTEGSWSNRMKRYAGESQSWPLKSLAPIVLRFMWLMANRSKTDSSSSSPSKDQRLSLRCVGS